MSKETVEQTLALALTKELKFRGIPAPDAPGVRNALPAALERAGLTLTPVAPKLTVQDLNRCVQSLDRGALVTIVTNLVLWCYEDMNSINFDKPLEGADTVDRILELLQSHKLGEEDIRAFVGKP